MADRSTLEFAGEVHKRTRALAELETQTPVILSTYLNLDPTEFPTPKQRQAQIESLMDEARSHQATLDLAHDDRAVLGEDIQRVRNWTESSLDASGTHGAAIFVCSSLDLFEAFRLTSPIGPKVRIARHAYLKPLVLNLPRASWCVFAVNRRVSRVLLGSANRLTEVGATEDDVRGQHDQGGWSQARFQRSIEEEVSDHVRNACDRLFEVWQRSHFDHVVVGCPSELWPRVEAKLHSYLSERVIQRFDAEVEHENPDELLERVRPIIEQHERRQETQLLERLSEELGQRDRAASGLASVLDALNSGRVELLLLATDLAAAGVICPRCGWLGVQGRACPADSTPVETSSDIVAEAIRSALLQGARSIEIRFHEPERALGDQIAALLRF